MGGAMLSKSLIQFFVNGCGCAPSLLFDLRPNCGAGYEDNGVLLHKVPCTKCSAQCPNPAAGHQPRMPLPDTPGHSWASLGWSLVWSLLLSPGSWCTRFSLFPSRVCFPVLSKFWWLYGGVNGDLLQEGFCHTQVCFTQSP